MKARSLVHVAPRRVEIRDVELQAPGPGEVLVRTVCSGISGGTELLVYRGEAPRELVLDEALDELHGTFSYPFAYGYGCVGRVQGLDEPLFAFHPHQDIFVIRRQALVPLPGVPPRTATLFPLVETALQVTLDAGPRAGEPVVVLGLGVLGTLTAMLLQRAGALPLCAEPLGWRRALAASLGLRVMAPELLPDAIDASGNPDAPGQALVLLAHEGTLLVASWLGTKLAPLPLGGAFLRRRRAIRSTQVSTIPSALAASWTVARRRTVAAELLEQLPLAALATHEFPFGRAEEAFAALDRGEVGLMHAALSF